MQLLLLRWMTNDFFLEDFINRNIESKILVFVRTKVRAERVYRAMERVGIVTDTIHSDRDQEEREAVMRSFRNGELKVLIATDVSARGIDIPNVDFVINYDSPETQKIMYTVLGEPDVEQKKDRPSRSAVPKKKKNLAEIENNLGKPIQRIEITKKDYKITLESSNH